MLSMRDTLLSLLSCAHAPTTVKCYETNPRVKQTLWILAQQVNSDHNEVSRKGCTAAKLGVELVVMQYVCSGEHIATYTTHCGK